MVWCGRRRVPGLGPVGAAVVPAAVTLLIALTGCTGSGSAAGPASGSADRATAALAAAVSTFATDWQSGRTADASRLTDDPAAAAQLIDSVTADLKATDLTVRVGRIQQPAADSATATATLTWQLPIVGEWSYPVSWQWSRASADGAAGWLLHFSPQVIHPDLGPAQALSVRAEPGVDGPLVDRNDVQLIAPVRVYSVVLLVNKVTDLTATSAAVAGLVQRFDRTITAATVSAGASAARAAGQESYTVINLREGDFAAIETKLDAIAGLAFPSQVRDLPPTPGFAADVLGSAVPVAEKMAAGRPGWRVVTVDMAGDDLRTVAQHPAVPGPKVTFTLDPAVQNAAQAAIDPIAEPAVLVAVQPSTGEILAVAQNRAADAQGPIALTGRYPPGSTFKIVTATAAIDAGSITPTSTVNCPGEWTTEQRTIHNEGFSLGRVTATTAFARSCNTTFAMLAAQLPAAALPAAARQYGIGLDFDVAGITTLTGAIQAGQSTLARAENGFGQGTDLVTPFSAALMAATAATGNMPMPILIRGTTTTVDQPAPPRSAAVRAGLRTMMRAVVTDGTATALRGDGTVYAKTGTAEYVDAAGAIQAHAWTVGFRGDIAFSVLIVGGNSSHRTNGIAHAFLAALPAM